MRFAPVFGLGAHEPPLPLDPFPIDLLRAEGARADPAVDWLAARVLQALADA